MPRPLHGCIIQTTIILNGQGVFWIVFEKLVVCYRDKKVKFCVFFMSREITSIALTTMAPATDNSVPVLSETKSKLKVIAFALDLTGKKLIDEICHISACHESGAVFDQYIMTHRDISRSSIRSHGIRIFTMLG